MNKKPNKDGIYWYFSPQDPTSPRIGEVYGTDVGPIVYWTGIQCASKLSELAGRWVGPLRPPASLEPYEVETMHWTEESVPGSGIFDLAVIEVLLPENAQTAKEEK